jgi:hypothetical protein
MACMILKLKVKKGLARHNDLIHRLFDHPSSCSGKIRCRKQHCRTAARFSDGQATAKRLYKQLFFVTLPRAFSTQSKSKIYNQGETV